MEKLAECIVCGCNKGLHTKYGPCFGEDCNCDYYESESSQTDKYCDSCLMIAYDHVGHGQAEQVQFLEVMGPDLSDHECDAITEPDLSPCACGSH